MEKMSDREVKLLHDLQAKQKRVQRADTEFFKNVEERKDEVLQHLNCNDRLQEVATLYGISADDLYKILTDPEQIENFKRHYLNEEPDVNDAVVIAETESDDDPIQTY